MKKVFAFAIVLVCIVMLFSCSAIGGNGQKPSDDQGKSEPPSGNKNTSVKENCVHIYSNWIVDESASDSKSGKKHRTCEKCGKTENMDIPMLVASSGLQFEMNTDGSSYSVTGIGNCKDKNVIIPSFFGGKPVTEIGKAAFAETTITGITVPKSVATIGEDAFSKSKNLQTINFNSGLAVIGEHAFFGCASLTNLTLPMTVHTIGSGAFNRCSALKSVTLSENLRCINDYLFFGCEKLVEVKLPSKIRYIEGSAFEGCKALKNINIPDSVEYIGEYAFSDCKSLTKISLGKNVNALIHSTFSGCSALEEVKIFDNISYADDDIFSGCENLKYYKYNNAWYLGNEDNKHLVLIKTTGTGVSEVSIADGTRVILGYAFKGCSKLSSIKIPNSVRSIGMSAFSGCSNLRVVNMSSNILNIGDGAFSDCEQLILNEYENGFYIGNQYSPYIYLLELRDTKVKNMTIAEGTRIVSESAFSNCNQLEEVTIPNSVKQINSRIFDACPKLKVWKVKGIYYLNSGSQEKAVAVFPYDYSEKTSKKMVVADGTKVLAECSFMNLDIKSIVLPSSISTIGIGAFAHCNDLKEIIFRGTKSQWENISKGALWDKEMNNYVIRCTDGDIQR